MAGQEEYKPPIHGAGELFSILQAQHKANVAIEFIGARDSAVDQLDDDARIKSGRNTNSIRLSQFERVTNGSAHYVVMLLEHVDQEAKSFPVVDTSTFRGREISGDRNERGGTSCHVLVKLPVEDGFDDGSYRCVVEQVSPISRKMIERFICNQLRRVAAQQNYTFPALVLDRKRNKNVEKTYKYYPAIELHSDVGRPLGRVDELTQV